MSSKRSNIIAGVILAILIIGVILVRSMVYVVDERDLAVILQFGEPVRSIEEPGMYLKAPFIQEVRRLPRTLQIWVSQEDIVDLPTADGKKIEVAAWAVWRIENPLKFVQTLRTVENGGLAVKDRVRAAIRDEITSYDLAEVVRSSDRGLTYSFRFELPDSDLDAEPVPDGTDTPQGDENQGDADQAIENETVTTPVQPGVKQNIEFGRKLIVDNITKSVRDRLEGKEQGEIDRGIRLIDVGMSNIGFVPAVREAAFERLRAFMDSIAAGYTSAGEQRKQEIINRTQAEVEKILGNAERQANIIRGETDARIIKDYAEAIQQTGDFYRFVKQLELFESSLNQETRLILTTDSELFQMLRELPRRDDPNPEPN